MRRKRSNSNTATVIVVAGTIAALIGGGTWYVNGVYLPRQQIEKAKALQTEASGNVQPGTDYDYTIPVGEVDAPTAEPEPLSELEPEPELRQTEPLPEPKQEPKTEAAPSDVYITRDYHDGGKSTVSTEPPKPKEEEKPTPPPQPTVSKPTTPTPKPAEPKPEPEPLPEPEPEPEPLEESTTPRQGDTRIINGLSVTWFDGIGWIPTDGLTSPVIPK